MQKKPNSRGPMRYVRPEQEHFINSSITAPEVRLVGDNLDNSGEILPTKQALEQALSLQLDLVEISPNAIPPVCRIVDYNKFLYEKKRREKEIKANATKAVLKEIRFTSNTDGHDFEFKAKHAEEFILEGSKVRASVLFRGRAIMFKDRGDLLLLKLADFLSNIAQLEQMPKMEGRKMVASFAPKKNAPKKKTDEIPEKSV